MLFHDYLVLCRQNYTFCSNFQAVPPHPPLPKLMGGTSPEASTESPEASCISPGARGGDQSRGIENTERVTLNCLVRSGAGIQDNAQRTMMSDQSCMAPRYDSIRFQKIKIEKLRRHVGPFTLFCGGGMSKPMRLLVRKQCHSTTKQHKQRFYGVTPQNLSSAPQNLPYSTVPFSNLI